MVKICCYCIFADCKFAEDDSITVSCRYSKYRRYKECFTSTYIAGLQMNSMIGEEGERKDESEETEIS